MRTLGNNIARVTAFGFNPGAAFGHFNSVNPSMDAFHITIVQMGNGFFAQG
jgi:hypothetical protein